ncbi:hypothetical protein F4819DRAFT_453343 [Hypoxylon fuscum]|nr:hypothetical protein F4819DRAFT_453343 [Hypoxylon fuscum]
MQALTTVFTAPSWCLDRFVVYIDTDARHSSTLSPTRGWNDPSFSQCVPSQYTTSLQVLSPGICPDYMTIARTTSEVNGSKTSWTGGCCQSGFSDMDGYFCTSTVTTLMAFLLEADVSTTDIYTTLSDLWIEHDQLTVGWQESDLKAFPKEVGQRYASIMGITLATTSESSTSTTAQKATQAASVSTTSAMATSTSTPTTMSPQVATSTPTETATVVPITDSTSTTTSNHPSSQPTTSDGGSRLKWQILISLVTWVLFASVLC